MEKIPNIQATKEYQFAKEVENMLNLNSATLL